MRNAQRNAEKKGKKSNGIPDALSTIPGESMMEFWEKFLRECGKISLLKELLKFLLQKVGNSLLTKCRAWVKNDPDSKIMLRNQGIFRHDFPVKLREN